MQEETLFVLVHYDMYARDAEYIIAYEQCTYAHRCQNLVCFSVEHTFVASKSTKHRPGSNFNTYYSRTQVRKWQLHNVTKA